ncbi:TniQ family protein [Lacrimispora sp. 210928-DFI.3.58]|uniref:TniQ family protein n=1 Tax=Lacrimispora sp. 210928-DFI.3.58 TaxID=2883214 RepID=UPI001D070FDD|nr:TniQ family protein [Lacrimispora sp. 210928-DFI.3.58]MCB7319889.1 TniQ family protein [Lacrimispora sp. 210928-DFI.3.58]
MIIPILFSPYQDELIYSWLLRLAFANGYRNILQFYCNYFALQPFTPKRTNIPLRMDYVMNLQLVTERFCEMQVFPDIRKIMKNMTPYYSNLLFYRYGAQAEKAFSILYQADWICAKPQHDFKNLRFCPDCMKEKMYFRTWHQLPGTKICSVHKKILYKTKSHKDTEISTLIKNSCPVSDEIRSADFEVSNFTKSMYDNPLFISYDGVLEIIREKMENQGYTLERPYGGLIEDMRQHGYVDLLSNCENPDKSIKGSLKGNSVMLTDKLMLLTFLFRDYQTFRRYADKWNGELEPYIKKIVAGKFELMSNFEPIIKLKCRACGYEFHIHPYDLALGGDCPICSQKRTKEENINRRLALIGDGEYELVGQMSRTDGKAIVLHKVCGKNRNISVKEIIWRERECGCKYEADINQICKQISTASKDFRFVEYYGKRQFKGLTGRHVLLQHKACGKMFTVDINSFLISPFCRLCEPPKHSKETFVKMLWEAAGDEYELVSEYKSLRDHVTILHKKCGTLTELSGNSLLAGQRCMLCMPRINRSDAERILEECTGGEYSIIDKGGRRGWFIVKNSAGDTMEMDSRMLLQELSRPIPGKFIKIRYQKPELPKRTLQRVYEYVRNGCNQSSEGTWVYSGSFDGIREQGIWSALRKLVKMQYLIRLDTRVFVLNKKRLPKEEHDDYTSMQGTI